MGAGGSTSAYPVPGSFVKPPRKLGKRLRLMAEGELKKAVSELRFGLDTGVPHPLDIDLGGVSLSLSTSRYGGDGLPVFSYFIARNTCLQTLKLCHCDLGVEELAVLGPALGRHPVLTELDLSHNKLTTESYFYAFHKPSLNNNMAGLRALAAAIRGHPSLRVLNLTGCELAGDGTTAGGTGGVAAKAVGGPASEPGGGAGGSADDAAAMRSIVNARGALPVPELAAGAEEGSGVGAEALPGRTTAQLVGDLEGARAIACAIGANTVLRKVTMRRTQLDVHVLKGTDLDNDATTALDFSDGGLGIEDVMLVATLLPLNKVTTALDLSDNAIGDGQAAVTLAAALRENETLTSLGAANTGIGGIGAAAFADTLRCTDTLAFLDVSSNHLGGSAGGTALAQAIEDWMPGRASERLQQEQGQPTAKDGRRASAIQLVAVQLQKQAAGDAERVVAARAEAERNADAKRRAAAAAAVAAVQSGADVWVAALDGAAAQEGESGAEWGVGGLLAPHTHPLEALCRLPLARLRRFDVELVQLDLSGDRALPHDPRSGWWLGLGGVAALAGFLASVDNAVEKLRLHTAWLPVKKLKGSESEGALLAELKERARDGDVEFVPGALDLSAQDLWCADVMVAGRLLERNEKLTSLDLSENSIVDWDLQRQEYVFDAVGALAGALRRNTSLVNLNLRANRLCGKGISRGGDSTKFDKIDSRAFLQLCEAIAVNGALRRLDISQNSVTADCKAALGTALLRSNICALQNVVCDEWALTPETRTLTLPRAHLNESDMLMLGGALRRNQVLTALDLSYNPLGEAGGQALSRPLAADTCVLVHLKLAHTELGEVGVAAVAHSLAKNRRLETLDLSENMLYYPAARHVGRMLLQNTALQALNLRANNLSPKGAVLLAESLKRNSSLTALDVSENGVFIEGAEAFASMALQNDAVRSLTLHMCALPLLDLKGDTYVKALNLSQRNLQPEDALVIGRLLEVNGKMKQLDLSLNNLGGWNFMHGIQSKTEIAGIVALREATHINHSLLRIKMASNGLCDMGKAELARFRPPHKGLEVAGDPPPPIIKPMHL
jgi:Ran GTPase-activating protein (RanGAP) involved in mRNA processing and transport